MAAAQGERQAECPNCGAPIAWKLASSAATVCSFCRFAVVRSDRDLTAIGKVVDLVPTAAPLSVGDAGSIAGKAFDVLGRTQLDHGRGPWDEWYVRLADGSWAWLARAQGRWYLTSEREGEAPGWDACEAGSTVSLSCTGDLAWKVAQRGGSALVSAEGELPYPFHPQESGRFADLEAGDGAFATVDFGDGSRAARIFVGREVPARDVVLKQSAVGPRPVEMVAVQRLNCPTCGGPIPLFVPSESERVGCPACGALLDCNAGTLRLLEQLEPPRVRPQIALGSQGTLFGKPRTLIGFMQRSLTVDGDLYTFREYLLHGEQGYAWLVEEDHHWLYVEPVSAGAVREYGNTGHYQNRTYRKFAHGHPKVDFVIGEFYWQVRAGDVTNTTDYVAPPRMLSVERSDGEINYSEGEYVERTVIERAFALEQRLPRPSGVAPAQPNPHRAGSAGLVLALLVLLWAMLAGAYELKQHPTLTQLDVEWAATAQAGTSSVQFSPSFAVTRGPTSLGIKVESPVDNGWAQIDVALMPESGGEPRELSVLVEHYHGYSDGESWSEGGTDETEYFGRVPNGRYKLRISGAWEDKGLVMPPYTTVSVREGDRAPWCCLGTFLLILQPFVLGRVRHALFEQRRKENENL